MFISSTAESFKVNPASIQQLNGLQLYECRNQFPDGWNSYEKKW